MAIQINLAASDVGPDYPTAYVNIGNSVEIEKSGSAYSAKFIVNFYAAKQYRDANKKPLFVEWYPLANLDPSKPIYTQLYAKLKTLAKFSGAIDV